MGADSRVWVKTPITMTYESKSSCQQSVIFVRHSPKPEYKISRKSTQWGSLFHAGRRTDTTKLRADFEPLCKRAVAGYELWTLVKTVGCLWIWTEDDSTSANAPVGITVSYFTERTSSSYQHRLVGLIILLSLISYYLLTLHGFF